MEALGVRFHPYKEPGIDSSEDGSHHPGRDMLRAVLTVIAPLASRRKAERVALAMPQIKAGRRRTRSGRSPGRPVRVTDEKVRILLALRAHGLRWNAIAIKVGLLKGTCSAVGSKAAHGFYRSRTATKGPGSP